MAKKEPLFELIKSLTQNEKRYFKQFSKLQKNSDNIAYVKLFDAIEQQQIYNEKKLQQRIPPLYFAQQKRHLYVKIMECLRLFHSQKNIDFEIASYLSDYNILMNKSLIKQASKVLYKAKKIATENERYTDIIKINKLESQLLWTENNIPVLANHINSYQRETKNLVHIIENQINFEKEYLNIINWNKKIEFIRNEKELNELKSILTQPIFENANQALSLSAKVNFHYIKGLFYFFLGDFHSSEQHFSNQLELLNQNEDFRKEEMFIYAKCLSNFTLLNLKLDNQSKTTLGIETLQQIKSQNQQVQNYVAYTAYLFELMHLNKQSKYKIATSYISKNSEWLTNTENWFIEQNILENERSYVLFQSITAFLYAGEHKKALTLMNSYLNKDDAPFKEDIYSIAIILNLFIHFEMDNKDLIENQLTSVERYLKSKKGLYDFEKTILNFIQRGLKVNSKQELRKEFKQLSTQLHKIKKTKFGRNVFEYFDFIAWVDAKCD